MFSVKEKIPDGHYLALMNMLSGKKEVPNIEGAKIVKIGYEHVYTGFNFNDIDDFIDEVTLNTDEEYENFEKEIFNRISLNTVYYEKILQVVDGGSKCSFNPSAFIDKNNNYISKYILKSFVESYQNDELYEPFLQKMRFRIKNIEVLA